MINLWGELSISGVLSPRPIHVQEARELLGWSASAVYIAARAGQFGARKVKGVWEFQFDEIQKYLRSIDDQSKIPISVAQFRAIFETEPSTSRHSPFLKIFREEYSETDIHEVASCLMAYFLDRNLKLRTNS